MAVRTIASAYIELRSKGGQLKQDIAGEVRSLGDAEGRGVGKRLGTGISEGARTGTQRLTADVGQAVDRAGHQASGAASRAGAQVGDRFREGMSSRLGDVGKDLAVGFAAVGIAEVIRGSLDASSALGEAQSKNNVLFHQGAADVAKFGETAATAFGIGKLEATQAAGTFGNLFRTVKIGEADSLKMSIALVKLAADLGSFNDKTPQEALEAIRSGLVGETEPLRNFGVNLNSAKVQAKAMSLGLASSNKTLTDGAKAQAVYALLMEQTTLAQGDFARTASSAANQQKILAAEFADSQLKLGSALMPTLQALLPLLIGMAKAVGTAADAWHDLSGPVQAAVVAFIAWQALQGRITTNLAQASGAIRTFTAQVAASSEAQRAAAINGAALAVAQGRLATAAPGAAASLATQVGMLQRATTANREAAAATTGLAGVMGRTGGSFATAAVSGQRFGRVAAVAAGSVGALRLGATGLIGALGGPWGIAITGAVLLIGTLIKRNAEQKAAQEAQTAAVQDYAKALEQSNGAVGDSIRVLAAEKLEKSGTLKMADDLGISLSRLGAAAAGNKGELTALNRQLDEIAKNADVFADLESGETKTPKGDKARALKKSINEAVAALRGGVEQNDRMARATDNLAGAQSNATPVMQGLATAAAVLRDTGQDATEKVNALKSALDQLAGKSQNARVAEAEFNAVLDTTKDNAGAVAKAFRGTKVHIDAVTGSLITTTAAGRAQQDAMVTASDKIKNAVTATYQAALDSGIGQAQAATLATAAYARQRAALVTVLTQMTGNRATAEKLAAAYLAVPTELDTVFGQPGMAEALADALKLGVRVQQIPGTKNVVMYADTKAAREALEKLGYKIIKLPNGKFGVILTGDQAVEDALAKLTRDRNARIFVQTYGRQGPNVDGTGHHGGYAGGGPVRGPGSSTSDSFLIAASDREYMIRATAAERIGLHRLDYMNRTGRVPAFAGGGAVGGDGASASDPSWRSVNYFTITAAPSVPTEQSIVAAIRQNEALHDPR